MPDEQGNPLTELEITEMVDREQRRLASESVFKPRVLIRADKEVATEHVKKAVEAAANGGVIDIIFAAYKVPPKS